MHPTARHIREAETWATLAEGDEQLQQEALVFVRQVFDDYAQLEQAFNESQKMLEAAKSSLQDKDAVIRYLENRPPPDRQTKSKAPKSERRPHPDTFTGLDKSKYDDWKMTM